MAIHFELDHWIHLRWWRHDDLGTLNFCLKNTLCLVPQWAQDWDMFNNLKSVRVYIANHRSASPLSYLDPQDPITNPDVGISTSDHITPSLNCCHTENKARIFLPLIRRFFTLVIWSCLSTFWILFSDIFTIIKERCTALWAPSKAGVEIGKVLGSLTHKEHLRHCKTSL